MKIIIMGAGALGSISAALLHKAGHDVTLVARGARAELLTAGGVRVEGLAQVTAPVPIVTDTSTLSEADLLIMTVKTFDMDAALQQLAHIKFGSTMSLQNGVMKDDQLAAAFGADTVLGAIANFSGAVSPEWAFPMPHDKRPCRDARGNSCLSASRTNAKAAGILFP